MSKLLIRPIGTEGLCHARNVAQHQVQAESGDLYSASASGLFGLERARSGLLHTFFILEALNALAPNDPAEANGLVNAALDLCGRHLENADEAIDSLRKLGGAQ